MEIELETCGPLRSSRAQNPPGHEGRARPWQKGCWGRKFGLVMALSRPVGSNAPPRPRRGPVASEMNCWAFDGCWCAAGFMPCAFKGVGVVLLLNFGNFMRRGVFYALGKNFYVCSENVYLFAQEWKRHINLL